MLSEVESFPGWGECFLGPASDDDAGDMYYTFTYISTYPDLRSMPGMYVSTTYPEDMCTSENMNYVEYFQLPLEALGIPFDVCVPSGPDSSIMYSASTCASTGQITVGAYNADCTVLYVTFPIFDNNCTPDDDDDGEDDDEDDVDDDDYELAGVTDNEFCT